MDKFISYLRVSTKGQGESGLGLEAQKSAVASYQPSLGEYVEVESGKRNARPELAKAFAQCRLTGATLVIAKLDRLSRDAHFLLGLEGAGIEFICADMPFANRLTIGVMALVAEQEGRAISARTKAALAAAKARGTWISKAGKVCDHLGGWKGGPIVNGQLGADANRVRADEYAARLAPVLTELQGQGLSLAQMAAALTQQGIQTARGGRWTPSGVRAVVQRRVTKPWQSGSRLTCSA